MKGTKSNNAPVDRPLLSIESECGGCLSVLLFGSAVALLGIWLTAAVAHDGRVLQESQGCTASDFRDKPCVIGVQAATCLLMAIIDGRPGCRDSRKEAEWVAD